MTHIGLMAWVGIFWLAVCAGGGCMVAWDGLVYLWRRATGRQCQWPIVVD